jgi:hypothetical protein
MMLARAVALAVALLTGAVGVLPSVAGHRCVWTGARMAAAHASCPERQAPATAIGSPCCEHIAAPTVQARATNSSPEVRIAPASLIGVITFAALVEPVAIFRAARSAARSERPPGERLHAFTSVLRV